MTFSKSTTLLAFALCILFAATQAEAGFVTVTGIRITKATELFTPSFPEIILACNFNTNREFVVTIGSIKTGVRFTFSKIFDPHLGVFETHTCFVVDVDNFTNAIDLDGEDRTNDIIGVFTISRRNFVNGFAHFGSNDAMIYFKCVGC